MSTLQQNLCVLFADVSGSNRLYEKLGDAEAAHAVERCIKRMERAVAVHSGRIVKIIGDEMMAVFGDAESAVQSAYEIQQRIDALPPVSGVKLSIRAGLHCGPAVEENNDIFGETVNIAARMVSLAKGGQIVTTNATVAELPAGLRDTARVLEDHVVKSKNGEIPICEMVWRDSAELLRQRATHFARPEALVALHLRHAGIDVPLDGSRETVSFGRDAGSDLIVADRRASRNHARIERRGNQFVLIDQSTNGTYVTFQGELEFALKNEEIPLRGRGRIAFGHSVRDANAEVVEFEIED